MRLRKLALAVGLAGALGAEMASALGLGEIKLNSSLDQPLDAEIKLLQTRDLSDGEILVSLATKDDFENAGVDRTFFLNDLKFIIQLNSPRGPIVRVTSSKPVREPYLNFLLQTQWPSGRILREYTLLMDLPVFSSETAKPVISKAVAAPKPKPAVKAAAVQRVSKEVEPEADPAPRVESKASASTDATYGPVKSSDTLWEIALKVRPNRSFSVQQTMLAIQRLNPEAFINGNINLLRRGQVLRVPDSEQITALESTEAVSQVAMQNNAWSNKKIPVAGAQLDASGRFDAQPAKSKKVEGRLSLAAASSESSRSGQSGSESMGSNDEALQNELAISLEELDKSKRENRELHDRVNELEDQISTMERLIEVSNQELRALQLAGKKKENMADASALDAETELNTSDADSQLTLEGAQNTENQVATTESPNSESNEVIADTSKVDEITENTDVDDKNDLAKAEAVKSPSSTLPKSAATPSFMDSVMENIVLVGAAIAALILALILLMRRRKPEEETTLEAYGSESLTDMDDSEEHDSVEMGGGSEQIDEDLDAEAFDEVLESEEEDAFSSESETGDAVAEADIYIAYGKFDQAEEMLLKSINSGEGDKTAASLKLLEVYAESDQLDKFDQQYVNVLALDDQEATERAAELRQQFVDAPEFDPESVPVSLSPEMETLDDVSVSNEEEVDDFDFDLGFDEPTEEESKGDDGLIDLDFEVDAEDTQSDIDDLDFDLNLDDDSANEDAESVEDSDLEFDLGLDDLEEEASSGGDDFDLNLENIEADEASDSDSLDFSEDFSLELGDLEGVDSEDIVDLDMSSTEDSMPETEEVREADDQELMSADTLDISDDLTAETDVDSDVEGDEGFQSFNLEGDALEPDVPEDVEDSEFDLSVDLDSDLDLASLDEEMDALSADLEDADDVSDSVEGLGSPDDSDLSIDDLSDDADVAQSAIDELDLGASEDVVTGVDLDLEANDTEELSLSTDDLDEELSPEMLDGLDESAEGNESLEIETDFDLSNEFGEFEEQEVSVDLEESSMTEALDEPLTDFDEVSVSEEPSGEVALDDSLSLEGVEELSSEELLSEESPAESSDLDEDVVVETEDDVFSEALSDFPETETGSGEDVTFDGSDLPVFDEETMLADEDLDAELDFLADTDEVATKLDLARAYIDMGDKEGAKDILDEVAQEGSDQQKQEASELMSKVE